MHERSTNSLQTESAQAELTSLAACKRGEADFDQIARIAVMMGFIPAGREGQFKDAMEALYVYPCSKELERAEGRRGTERAWGTEGAERAEGTEVSRGAEGEQQAREMQRGRGTGGEGGGRGGTYVRGTAAVQISHAQTDRFYCDLSAAEKAAHEWREKRKGVLEEMMQSQRVQDGAKDARAYRLQVMRSKRKKGKNVKWLNNSR